MFMGAKWSSATLHFTEGVCGRVRGQSASPLRWLLLCGGGRQMEFGNFVFYGGCVGEFGGRVLSPLRWLLLHGVGRQMEFGSFVFYGRSLGGKMLPHLFLEASSVPRRSIGKAVAEISRFTNCPMSEAHVV